MACLKLLYNAVNIRKCVRVAAERDFSRGGILYSLDIERL